MPGLCAGVGAGAAARAGLAAVAGGPQRAEVLRGAGKRVPRERGLAAGSERDGGGATGLASRWVSSCLCFQLHSISAIFGVVMI